MAKTYIIAEAGVNHNGDVVLAKEMIAAAKKAGATKEEVAAALGTAIALNAGAAYVYSARTLDAYDEL